MGMKRSRVVVGALLSLLPLSGLGVTAMRQHRSHDAVYSLAVVGAGLSHDPAAWVNRIVRVRARAEICAIRMDGPGSPCNERHPALLDADAGGAAPPLLLVRAPAPPLLRFLRHLPLLGQVGPAPQTLHWGLPTLYRIQLHATSCGPASRSACYEALLLDAAP